MTVMLVVSSPSWSGGWGCDGGGISSGGGSGGLSSSFGGAGDGGDGSGPTGNTESATYTWIRLNQHQHSA